MTITDGATDFEIESIEVERVNHGCLLCALDWMHPFQACQDNATQLHPRFCNSSFHNNIVIGAVSSWIKCSAWMARCIAASPPQWMRRQPASAGPFRTLDQAAAASRRRVIAA